jgi:hypothetical protein
MRRFHLGLFSSILLHLLIAAGLFWTITRQSQEPAALTIEVDVESLPNQKTARGEKPTFNAKKTFQRRASQTRLAKFFPQPNFGAGLTSGSEEKDPSKAERILISQTWQDASSYMPTLQTAVEFASRSAFYEELHRRIDVQILFDDVLAEYNHFGKILFYFAVNADGTLIPETLRAEALDRVLKVRAAKILRRSLAKPMDSNFHLDGKGPYWIAARFFYEKDSHCESLLSKSIPWLSFCRWTPTAQSPKVF